MKASKRIEKLLNEADKKIAEAKQVASDKHYVLCIEHLIEAQRQLDDALDRLSGT